MTTEEIRKDKTLPSPTTIFRIFKTTSINKVYEEVEDYKKITGDKTSVIFILLVIFAL